MERDSNARTLAGLKRVLAERRAADGSNEQGKTEGKAEGDAGTPPTRET